MTVRITPQGLLLPKELFAIGVEEVEIHRAGDEIHLAPVQDALATSMPPPADDPIWQIGENPVEDPLTDASRDPDHYLYHGR